VAFNIRTTASTQSDERITNAAHGPHLPPSWRTLYEITKLPDEVFEKKLSEGSIHPEMQRKDVARENRVISQARDQERVKALQIGGASAMALDQGRTGEIALRVTHWKPVDSFLGPAISAEPARFALDDPNGAGQPTTPPQAVLPEELNLARTAAPPHSAPSTG
jgi:hypothetical protein